jgi:peptide/nickel transport system permease protein
MKKWWHSKSGRSGAIILATLFFVCVFGDFLANQRPIFAQLAGKNYFPAVRGLAVDAGFLNFQEPFLLENWREISFSAVVRAPIPYSAQNLDLKNSNCRSPLDFQDVSSRRWRHWLGTDSQGRDVAAGLIRGTRVAILVGVLSIFLATILGVFLGSLAGFFGDNKFETSRIRLIINILATFGATFWGIIARSFWLTSASAWLESLAIIGVIFTSAFLISNSFERLRFSWLNKKITLPIDLIIMRLAEVFNGIPRLILFFAVAAIVQKPSIWVIILMIGTFGWTGIARIIRVEMLRIRELGYIQNARLLGLKNWKIIWRHALPNALPPLIVSIVFSIGGAILLEASLSFLGIGVPLNQVTWGSILNEGRSHFEAPWLVFFPGVLLFLTNLGFNLIGIAIQKQLNRRLDD